MTGGASIQDPAVIAETLHCLAASREEFPIRVDGAKTLPYAATLTEWQADRGRLLVKLLRPLPPALPAGALFDIVFSAQGKRFEAQIVFEGREAYLQYAFQAPTALTASDRRLWKRFPIRPRENLRIGMQDSGFPGHGITGPLLNLSLGGLAFRVDRMVRLEDGLPVRPSGSLFDRGMSVPHLRIHGLQRGLALEAQGRVARIVEEHGELHLGIQFTGLTEAAQDALTRFLEARERHTSPGARSGNTDRLEGIQDASDVLAAALEAVEPAPALPDGRAARHRLERRSAQLLLVSPPGPAMDQILGRLTAEHFWRVDTVGDLFEAHARVKAEGALPPQLLLVDLEPGLGDGLEAFGAARHMEPLLRTLGTMPVIFLTRRPDPMLAMLDRPGFGALALEADETAPWGEVLDGLLGIQA